MRNSKDAFKVHNGSHKCYPEYEALIFRNCSFAGNSGKNAAIPANSDSNNFNPDIVIIENCWFKDPARPFFFKNINNLTLKDLYMGGKLLTDVKQSPITFEKIGNLTFTAKDKDVTQKTLQ
jgi:hypothetical protein